MSATGLLETTVVRDTAARQNSDLAFGMMLIAIIPAAFWTATYAGVANLFGHAPGLVELIAVAGGIGLFLALVFALLRYRAT